MFTEIPNLSLSEDFNDRLEDQKENANVSTLHSR